MMKKEYAGLLLRLSLAFLFLYFGIDKFTALQLNVSTFEGLWLAQLVPFSAKTSVIVSGVFELSVGALLLLGLFNEYVSIGAATWNFLIVVNLGFSAAVYDIALVLVALALYITGPGAYSLKAKV